MQQIEWHGDVEIHLKASDWYLHKHQGDKNYETVVLHVVWENDCDVAREDQTPIPVLELKERIEPGMLENYQRFISSRDRLPCQYYLPDLPPVYLTSMFDNVLAERLERKGREVLKLNELNQNNWEETFWQVLAGNFGFKINNYAFAQLGKSLPYKILQKHADRLIQLEALLFGQSGLLDDLPREQYSAALRKEYEFLAQKYGIQEKKMSKHVWKFLRTRPYNFPTIRIAQLAALLNAKGHLINIIYEKREIKEYHRLLAVQVSPYWQRHYKFGEKMKGEVPGISAATVHNIITNVVIPFKTARYLAGLSEEFPGEVYSLLDKMPAELNRYSKQWKLMGARMKTTGDSQAVIELYNQYCIKRKCLYCKVGAYIVKH